MSTMPGEPRETVTVDGDTEAVKFGGCGRHGVGCGCNRAERIPGRDSHRIDGCWARSRQSKGCRVEGGGPSGREVRHSIYDRGGAVCCVVDGGAGERVRDSHDVRLSLE